MHPAHSSAGRMDRGHCLMIVLVALVLETRRLEREDTST
jgi:hypothetical protein